LHSGQYGGLVSEPLLDMTRLVATLHDANGHCAIPGFHADVSGISSAEAQLFSRIVARVKE
jgi:hypothetical protein